MIPEPLIPAHAGIQGPDRGGLHVALWVPAFAGPSGMRGMTAEGEE